jgi:hypothetical protein
VASAGVKVSNSGGPGSRQALGRTAEKFVVTGTAHYIIDTQRLPQPLDHTFQHGIARQMTSLGVDGTKVINVDHDQRDRLLRAASQLAHRRFEGDAVERSGQRATGHLARLF